MCSCVYVIMGVILKFETRTELETVNCMDSMLGLGTFLFVCLFIFLFVKGTTVHYDPKTLLL